MRRKEIVNNGLRESRENRLNAALPNSWQKGVSELGMQESELIDFKITHYYAYLNNFHNFFVVISPPPIPATDQFDIYRNEQLQVANRIVAKLSGERESKVVVSPPTRVLH